MLKPIKQKFETKAAPKDPADAAVGRKMKMARLMANLSQKKLGEALDLTSQQVQKYEKGMNRIGASRLHQIAGILGVDVASFFEGITTKAAPQNETQEFTALFERIKSPESRSSILQIMRVAAGA